MPQSKTKQQGISTALTKASQWSDPFSEYGEAATQLQLKIPVVKIEYLASENTQRDHPDWEKGKFSLSIGEQLDHLEVGLIGLRYGRLCYLAKFDPKNPNVDPDCKSDNGIFPSLSIEKPLTDFLSMVNGEKIPVCAHVNEDGEPMRNRAGKYVLACSYAQWGDRKTPPKCKDFFTLLLWEHQLNLPLIYTVKGTGIKHINQLHMDMIRAIREIPDKTKYPPSSYVKIIIRAVPNSNWYEPHFKIDKPFSEDEAYMNCEAKKDLVDSFQSMNTDDFAFDKDEEEN